MTTALIDRYVASLNDRRFDEGAALFATDSRFVWISFADPAHGPDGYREFASRLTAAFPDLRVASDHARSRGSDAMWAFDLVVTGTHSGVLDMGTYRFNATGQNVELRLQHLFESEKGRIQYVSVSIDPQDIVRRLTTLDLAALDGHLREIGRLRGELTDLRHTQDSMRELAERLGRELDAARHILRPHYRR